MTFDELANHILAGKNQAVTLKPECFAVSDESELFRIFGTAKPGEQALSPSVPHVEHLIHIKATYVETNHIQV